MADTNDSNSFAERRVGSTPTSGTEMTRRPRVVLLFGLGYPVGCQRMMVVCPWRDVIPVHLDRQAFAGRQRLDIDGMESQQPYPCIQGPDYPSLSPGHGFHIYDDS